ncbi:hypothetical protein MHOL44478_12710 [Mycobacterium holsaticum DSM 44478]|nr:hypothetical protein [Mycolicibacterium holsaticum DSM 44478 = JCM 12374]QZA14470.1 hypothetical protein K3U96_10385 [Mycolicibacterium holsaticum DSM 44478 = JCM 12374]UNC08082.1 hypothetical protein H5U41_16445 [Mycolicibacterium holsaticum DSM 44478 = JCM 12374]
MTGANTGTHAWYRSMEQYLSARPISSPLRLLDCDMPVHGSIAPDVDLVELYYGFRYLTLAWLEALGFGADGEGGPIAGCVLLSC